MHKIPQATTVPVRSFLYSVRVNSLSPLASFATINEEIKQLRELQTKNAELQSQLTSLQSLKEENVQMRRLLDTGLPADWKFSSGRVTSIYGDSVYLLSDSAPSIGTPAIISTEFQESTAGAGKAGVFVGRVKELIGNQTKVDLVTNPLSKIPAVVRDAATHDRRASGIVQGKGGKTILEQVLATEDLHEGDLIITNGDGGLPPDLLIGSVGRVLTGGNATLKQAEVKLAIEPESLQYVFLITKY